VRWRRGKGGPAERQIRGLDGATTLGDLVKRHVEALINRQPVCRGRIAAVLADRLIATFECGRGDARIVDSYIRDRRHFPGSEPGYNQQSQNHQGIENTVHRHFGLLGREAMSV
jgi:hypothetical protein